MSGFIQLNNQHLVLLSLPNGEMIHAAVDELIGKERAQLILIEQGLTTIELPDKKRILLRMSVD
jgi:hypothetical protein